MLPNSFHNLIKLYPRTTLSFGVSTVFQHFHYLSTPSHENSLINIYPKLIKVYYEAKDHLQWKILIIVIFLVQM